MIDKNKKKPPTTSSGKRAEYLDVIKSINILFENKTFMGYFFFKH